MLSYQHGYHAGNFADVIKHLALTRILAYMTAKDKPLFYLETHSGRGRYDLQDKYARKTGEYLEGVSLLWNKKQSFSSLFDPYIQAIEHSNKNEEQLRYYPGSPALAIDLLRQQDRLFCCELHPREFDELTTLARQGKRVFYSQEDGLAQLTRLLPPPERRGLIFIDPSYEIKQDYKQIAKVIKAAYERFPTGIFCLWYPLLFDRFHEQLLRSLADSNISNKLRVEFNLNKSNKPGMSGCGLLIINPPYTLAKEMGLILKELQGLFQPESSFFNIET